MSKNNSLELNSGSYKDPSGFIFKHKNEIFRQINKYYQSDYDLLMKSGLYKELIDEQKLIQHQETDIKISPQKDICYKIIKPKTILFFSYPYEWSFNMLKDAALLTLSIQKKALEHDLILKDASAYNITYHEGKPIFIDTLSFEKYLEGNPWVAYRQFCQHFLAPLALAAYKDLNFIPLLRNFLDGYPLEFAAKLMPKKSLFNINLLLHLHSHAKTQTKLADNKISVHNKPKISKLSLLRLIDNLYSAVNNIKLPKTSSQWGDYYNITNY